MMEWMLSIECGWIILQVAGLIAAWMVRAQTGQKSEGLAEGLFFFCFSLIALATIAGHQTCSSMWILSATTLSIMMVTVVLDFNSQSGSQGTSNSEMSSA